VSLFPIRLANKFVEVKGPSGERVIDDMRHAKVLVFQFQEPYHPSHGRRIEHL
jgi:hypothetical protein